VELYVNNVVSIFSLIRHFIKLKPGTLIMNLIASFYSRSVDF
jgi:hypothetical protein